MRFPFRRTAEYAVWARQAYYLFQEREVKSHRYEDNILVYGHDDDDTEVSRVEFLAAQIAYEAHKMLKPKRFR